jgi:hypothetical protein
MAELAGRIVKQREILRKLKEAGAISPETAVTAKGADVYEGYFLSELVRWGRITKTSDSRYYAVSKGKYTETE